MSHCTPVQHCSVAWQVRETADATDNYGWLHGFAGSAISSFIVGKWKDVLARGFAYDQKHFLDHLHSVESSRPRFNADALLKANTFREWDAAVAPAYGFASVDEMYSQSDVSAVTLWEYRVPSMLINAIDDPICPAGRMKGGEYAQPHLAVITTRQGGHLGWIDGRVQRNRPASQCSWLRSVTLEFVAAASAYTPKII